MGMSLRANNVHGTDSHTYGSHQPSSSESKHWVAGGICWKKHEKTFSTLGRTLILYRNPVRPSPMQHRFPHFHWHLKPFEFQSPAENTMEHAQICRGTRPTCWRRRTRTSPTSQQASIFLGGVLTCDLNFLNYYYNSKIINRVNTINHYD